MKFMLIADVVAVGVVVCSVVAIIVVDDDGSLGACDRLNMDTWGRQMRIDS